MTGMLKLKPDATYYFDARAADRPVRFIEKFCRHFEGRHAGKPFVLHPVQRKIVRDIYGWKVRATKRRRFTDVYFEAAVGAGKSPLLAGLGLYGLMGDGEQSPQIYSLASTYGQAKVVFDTAKRFARENRELQKRLTIVEREIRYRGGKWEIVSGKGPGAGCKPSMILGDEVHQWAGAGAYQDLRDRMFKREQPILFAATNAGESRASFCWTLREKAVAALKGDGDPSLYPIIFGADEAAAIDDPKAWRAANPLLGVTMSEESVRQKVAAAIGDPVEETDTKRLYLGIWPKAGAGRWLELDEWDACVSEDLPPIGAPEYIGLDLSQGDDLCAAAFVRPTAERFFVGVHFWLPKATAEMYQERDGITYEEWAEAGHITLLEERTITPAVRLRIAEVIAKRAERHEVKAVCYDRYRADEAVATLEAKGITCVPVPQGYSLSPGCHEFERRMREGPTSLSIWPNAVLRWNAENCEVKADDRGNIWPVKPNAKDRYAGTRAKKIDGITAIVTAMVEAKKHTFPLARKQSKAQAYLI